MQHLTFTSQIKAAPGDVFAWHARPGALHRLIPPWENVDVLKHGGIAEGDRAKLNVRIGPFSAVWHAEHTDIVDGSRFTDVQVKGPFKHWRHEHVMEQDDGGCRLTDAIQYELPFARLYGVMTKSAVRRRLVRQFAYRHRTTRNDLRLHARYGDRTLRVAVAGASGLIGRPLVHFLEAGGHEVLRIVRNEPVDPGKEIYWNYLDNVLETDKLEGLDAVINLAGENVFAPRWSDQKKMEILGSRVGGTKQLAGTLAKMDDPPRALVSASAIGYYGDRGQEEVDESSPPGDDGFLSAVCQEWEMATATAKEAGIRTVQLRIGIVLTPSGGILPTFLLPFQLGLGGRYGGEHQFFSWIGIDDVLGATYHTLHHEDLTGPVNLTAPTPVTMSAFADVLGEVLSRPTAVNLPPTLIRLLLGEVADDAALMSIRALPARLAETGYEFLHPNLEGMLRHALGRTLEPVAGPGVEDVPVDSMAASD